MKEYFKLGLILFLVGALAALALALVYIITAPLIQTQKEAEMNAALQTLLPNANVFTKTNPTTFQAKDRTLPVGKIYIEKPVGYAGPIEMLVAIDNQGTITGVKILTMKETAGLGTKVLETKFLKQFVGKSIKDTVPAAMTMPLTSNATSSALRAEPPTPDAVSGASKPIKSVDAITGATVTSKAVIRGAKSALDKFSAD